MYWACFEEARSNIRLHRQHRITPLLHGRALPALYEQMWVGTDVAMRVKQASCCNTILRPVAR